MMGAGVPFGGGGMGGYDMGMGGAMPEMSPHKMPVIGSMFQNPEEIRQRQQMAQMAQQYGAMRPETQAAQMNALRASTQMYQPYQDLLGMGYGMGMPTQGIYESPLSANALSIGNPQQGGGGMGAGMPFGMPGMAGMGGMPGMGGMGGMPGMPNPQAGAGAIQDLSQGKIGTGLAGVMGAHGDPFGAAMMGAATKAFGDGPKKPKKKTLNVKVDKKKD